MGKTEQKTVVEYENEFLTLLNAENSFQKLYQNKIVKQTSYCNNYARILMNLPEGPKAFFDQIRSNPERQNPYKVPSHIGVTNKGELKEKTRFQWEIRETYALFNYFQKNNGSFKILDYQTPMRDTSNDNEKNIDLVGTDGKNLYLLEYKRMISEESLLRSVLEVYSYRRLINEGINKFASDFGYDETDVIPAIIMMEGSSQWKSYQKQSPDSPIISLMKELGVKAFVIKPEKEFVENQAMKIALAEEKPEFSFSLSIIPC